MSLRSTGPIGWNVGVAQMSHAAANPVQRIAEVLTR
jgi:hypothetical protein